MSVHLIWRIRLFIFLAEPSNEEARHSSVLCTVLISQLGTFSEVSVAKHDATYIKAYEAISTIPVAPFLTWITFMPAWISDRAPCNVFDEITYPFPNFRSLRIDKQFHPTRYNACDYLSMLELNLTHISYRGILVLSERLNVQPSLCWTQ